MVVDIALAQEREHLALSLQEGLYDCLNVGSPEVDTLSEGRDLNLAVADRVGQSWRAISLCLVSEL